MGLLIDGKRLDGRGLNELRKVEIEIGVVERASGSARVRLGKTDVIAVVHGPKELHPAHLREAVSLLRCTYSMSPFSTDERKAPGADRRSIEISKVIRQALQPAICLEEFPKAVIDVYINVIQADGSTRVAGINAASVALAAAGIPMHGLVAACTGGKIDGKLALDLNGVEDMEGEADVSLALIPRKHCLSLLQMDGLLSPAELRELLRMLTTACIRLHKLQCSALKKALYGSK